MFSKLVELKLFLTISYKAATYNSFHYELICLIFLINPFGVWFVKCKKIVRKSHHDYSQLSDTFKCPVFFLTDSLKLKLFSVI